ncbi:hypothetical protein CFIMG_001884RA [Ceratocystis fimbriata CBS 114723]|uniref:Nudix hydrolase domain-containing protein n=1 Tax=Ceratocystis fimbriata CBS 114723 TaxID=1035309 RepID=A0A2C5X182_9PEZI|nr:hypothetical protein CFIMG_001884RA [Ceratocystis fimbriata CBS 114723]
MGSVNLKKAQPVDPLAIQPIRPSSSVVLVSPVNQILLLHRVRTSTSFASAHVFPGGNIDQGQDGQLPKDPIQLHQDSLVYRLAAIRECFEESGILLAKSKTGEGIIQLPNSTLQKARHQTHEQKINFLLWLEEIGAHADTDGLVPFTRWVTPIGAKRRFTTQMYLYFMPLSSPAGSAHNVPTTDGGMEHTEVRFDDASNWIQAASKNEIMLFPPQIYLLSHIAKYLTGLEGVTVKDRPEAIMKQRRNLAAFLHRLQDGTDDCAKTSWAEKVISPMTSGKLPDGRVIMTLDRPGPELKTAGRHGDREQVVIAKFTRDGVSSVEVQKRQDVTSVLKL